jgi:type I restriction enzyme, S subunit
VRGVPEGWVEARIGEVSQSPVATWNGTEGGEFTYVQISSVDRDGKVITDPEVIAVANAPSRAKQVLRAGDVLVSLTRPNLNAVAFVGPELDGAVASTGFHVIRGKGVVPGFLFYAVQDPAFVSYATDLVQGVMYPAIRPRDVLEYTLPLAPLPEQHRIVAKIEELFSELDAGVAALERARAKLERYRASVLKAAVEGRLTEEWRKENPPEETGEVLLKRILAERRKRWEEEQLAAFEAKGKKPSKGWREKYQEPQGPDMSELPELPEGWCWGTVEQVGNVVRGASPRPAGDPRFFGGSHTPWITVGSLTGDRTMFLNEVSLFLTEEGRLRSRYVEPGTLLLTNSGATLGVPKITLIGGCINDGSVAVEWLENPLKEFVYYHLATLTRKLRSINQGAAQPNLNTTIVKNLAIPLPPPEEQAQVCRMLQDALADSERLSATLSTAETRTQTLRQAILKLAFEGRLVPQDPNDEPASVLLERIRASRKAGQPATKRRPRKRKSSQGSLDL